MAINKKLIHFKNKENFNTEVANGNILNTSIVFIQDTQEIYTHGQFYDGSKIDLSGIEASIQNIIDTYATKTEIPTKLSQLENDINAWSVIMTAGLCWDNGDFILFDNNEKII